MENYLRSSEGDVIKNTRILFTKVKDLDQIIRVKKFSYSTKNFCPYKYIKFG